MKKRFYVLVVALLCLSMLAACTNTPTSQSTTSAATATPAATATENSASAEPQPSAEPQQNAQPEQPDNGPAAGKENFNPTGYPVCDEPITLTGFGNQNVTHCDWKDAYTLNAISDLTNVYIEWETAPNTGFEEAKSVLLAGGDYPDIFWRCKLTSSELATYGPMGVFADLKQYIEAYMPTLVGIMQEYPSVRSAFTSADGAIYGLNTITSPDAPTDANKYWVNGQWIANVGLEEPTTIEELTDLFRAFRDQDANGNGDPSDELPYSDRQAGKGLWNGTYSSFGMGNLGQQMAQSFIDLDENGQIRCFAVTDEYKAQLEWITSMYNENLIDPEMFTQDIPTFTAKGNQNLIGAFFHSDTPQIIGSEHVNFFSIAVPEGPGGNSYYYLSPMAVNGGAFAVNAERDFIAEACRWCDFFYTREGCEYMQLGQKDVTYTVTDGVYKVTDMVNHDPEGKTAAQVLGSYGAFNAAGGACPTFIYADIENGRFTESEAASAAKLAAQMEDGWAAISLSFTEDEQELYNEFANDIQTYIVEWRVNVVCGQDSISNWDSYVANLEKMGLNDYVAVYQAAYDRYSAS